MAASSHSLHAAGTPEEGRASGVERITGANPLLERLRNAKREAVEQHMGKGESWCKKLIANESGILVEDLPQLMAFFGLKVVRADWRCIDPELLRSYETLARKAINDRRLLEDDAE